MSFTKTFKVGFLAPKRPASGGSVRSREPSAVLWRRKCVRYLKVISAIDVVVWPAVSIYGRQPSQATSGLFSTRSGEKRTPSLLFGIVISLATQPSYENSQSSFHKILFSGRASYV